MATSHLQGQRLLIIVPARGGSKRIPRKNIRALGNRTLLERTHDAIAGSGVSATCLLSTDDEEIAELGRRLGWLVPFLRPTSLAADSAPTLPVVYHALDWYASAHGGDPDLLMLLQVTSPFRDGGCISRALEMIMAKPDTEGVLGVRQLNFGPARVFTRDVYGHLNVVDASNDVGPTFTPNGAMYLVRCAALRAQNTLYPLRTLPLVMDEISSIDIDTERDWQLAEAAVSSGLTGKNHL